MRKKIEIILFLSLIILSGCVKEEYDLDKLSDRAEISPKFVIPVFRGTVILGDAVKPSDTVVYDSDKFVRFVYRKDSVINIELDDYFNPDELVTFSDTYDVDELSISPFTGTFAFTLGEVTANLDAGLRNQFVALDDGAAHAFPAFPAVNPGIKNFSAFPNFEYADFSSGFLDISVTNNLTAPLSGVVVTLSNTYGVVGTTTLNAVDPGETFTTSINLSGKRLTNVLTASAMLGGSPGNASPVIIDLDGSNILFTAASRELKVTSGRIIVPSQLVSDVGSTDVISFDPGDGIELESLKVNSATLSWEAEYNANINASLQITFPTIIRNGIPLTESISVNQAGSQGSLNLENTTFSFNSDPSEPYNKIPLGYTLSLTSNNILIDYNSSDKVQVQLKLVNNNFDFLKGYFGQRSEIVEPETIESGIEEYLRNISGDIHLANPSIKLSYKNSFALPIEVTLNGKGINESEEVDLGLDPFLIDYPSPSTATDISSSFTVNNDNSELPELISLPPESMVFRGSARLNPAGDPDHLRNNYIYGNSRFVADLEVELPLELSLTNLELSDTTKNFLADEELGSDFNTKDFELARIGMNFKNRFPFDVSVTMSLYDSTTGTVKNSIDIPGVLKAAPVDNTGKVNGTEESAATIEVTQDFLDDIDSSDQIIFTFKAGTTDSKVVKIYSDYRVDFNLTLYLASKINL